MFSARNILVTLACLAVGLGVIGAGVALLGHAWWGAYGWYYHYDVDYRLGSGQQALRQGDQDLGEQIALVLEADGYGDQAALLRGEAYFRRAQPYGESKTPTSAYPLLIRALQEFNEIRDKGKLRLQAAVFIGQAYLHLHEPFQALNAFELVRSEEPDNVEAHRGLAAVYYDQGASVQALANLEKVAELAPRDGRPHRLMGLIYKESPDYARAVQCYRAALERDLPSHAVELDRATIRKELAECLLRLGHYDEALEVLAEVESAPEDTVPVEALRAECLMGLNRSSEARVVLDQALAADANRLDLLRLRAQLHLDGQEPAAAAALLEQALRLDRHDYACRYLLLQAYQRQGRRTEVAEQQRLLDQAKQDLAELTRLNREAATKPWDVTIRQRLVELCEKMDKPDIADMWRRAAANCPAAPLSRSP